MNFNEYQALAIRTAKANIRHDPDYLVLGLTGEAGEVANNRKKEIRDCINKTAPIVEELGDVLWYIALLAEFYGYSLEELARENVEKLAKRHPDMVAGGLI